ncbi:MAG: glycosyltransferase family 4 protein [Candidatus Berkelbacteria bacterium]|nr:glycosyltransferase family 4 protein [Candidatus Berkelbacteria bacterium]
MENKVKNSKNLLGIDASRSNVAQRTGTEYYSYEIIKAIVENDDFKYRLYSRTPIEYLKVTGNIQSKVMSFPRLWSQFRLSCEILRNPPDVLFIPAHTIPLYHGRCVVTTLHDVGFRHFPELYTPLERYYHDFCMRFAVKHATRIIAISEATKKDIIKFYNAKADKIRVIYHGYTKEKYYPLKKGETASQGVEALKPFIFFIGRIEAKKNVKNLIKAYGLLRKDPLIKHKLVLAGRPGYQYEEIKSEVENLEDEIKKDVVELGYVEDDTVSELTRHASVFAFPSRFEGFGMPIIETMASGVPVVASNTSSIPEIASGAALLSDPGDIKNLSHNLFLAIKDIKTRNDLTQKGLRRASEFSWEKSARQTLEVIREAYKQAYSA